MRASSRSEPGWAIRPRSWPELSGRVWSVEIVEELAGQAEANLRQLGCSDVAIRIGDGSRGWREHAPYDRALLTGRRRAIASGDPRSNQTRRTDRSAAGPGRGTTAHGGRQRGGWTDQCSATGPGAVQPARDGRVRHSYAYRSAPQARSHAVRPLPQDGPRGLPHHVSREAAVFEVMLTRGYSGTRAGTFIIPIPGAIARAMNRRPRCGPRSNGRAQRCPCPPALVRGYELIEGHRCVSTAGFVEPFNFAAVGARQPTSPARVLEVRIRFPPAVSQQTFGSAVSIGRRSGRRRVKRRCHHRLRDAGSYRSDGGR